MGGGQSLAFGLRNLDVFEYVGGFSSATPDENREAQFAEMLANADGGGGKPELLWIGCGREDFLFQRNDQFSAWLEENGIDHTYRVTDGAHTWRVLRGYLQEFLPLLFRLRDAEGRGLRNPALDHVAQERR